MKYMHHGKRYSIGWMTVAASLWALGAACRSEMDEAEPTTRYADAPPTMSIGVVAEDALLSSLPAGTRMSPPVFLFWDASTLLRTDPKTDPTPELFFVASPQDSVPVYSPTDGTTTTDRERWYDTGHPYLDDDQTVLVSGFLPAAVAADADDETKTSMAERYAQLTVPPEMLALDSVWIAREARLGSSYNPFSKALCFVHASTRLIVKAQLASGMPKQVKGVQVRVSDSSAVLYRLQWQSYETNSELTKCGYVGAPFDKATDWDPLTEAQKTAVRSRLTSPTYASNLPTALVVSADAKQKAVIDTFYLRPGLSFLTLDIDATMGGTQNYRVRRLPVQLQDAQGQTLTLSSGDSYELTLHFSKADVQVSGQIVDFYDGENLYIGVQPFTTTIQNE